MRFPSNSLFLTLGVPLALVGCQMISGVGDLVIVEDGTGGGSTGDGDGSAMTGDGDGMSGDGDSTGGGGTNAGSGGEGSEPSPVACLDNWRSSAMCRGTCGELGDSVDEGCGSFVDCFVEEQCDPGSCAATPNSACGRNLVDGTRDEDLAPALAVFDCLCNPESGSGGSSSGGSSSGGASSGGSFSSGGSSSGGTSSGGTSSGGTSSGGTSSGGTSSGGTSSGGTSSGGTSSGGSDGSGGMGGAPGSQDCDELPEWSGSLDFDGAESVFKYNGNVYECTNSSSCKQWYPLLQPNWDNYYDWGGICGAVNVCEDDGLQEWSPTSESGIQWGAPWQAGKVGHAQYQGSAWRCYATNGHCQVTPPSNDGVGWSLHTDDYPSGTCAGICDNGALDDGETCTDAGGVCASLRKCADFEACVDHDDCESNSCDEGICAPAHCSDNIKSGDESDVDCGGSCVRCVDTKTCNSADDCESRYCPDGDPDVCETSPSCADGWWAEVNESLLATWSCATDGSGEWRACQAHLDCAIQNGCDLNDSGCGLEVSDPCGQNMVGGNALGLTGARGVLTCLCDGTCP